MTSITNKLKKFWRAEEVPRSIGLLFVLVYVVALSGVSISAHNSLRVMEASHQIDTHNSCLQMLADILPPVTEASFPQVQTALKHFAASRQCTELRIYDNSQSIVASLVPEEIGQPLRVRDQTLTQTPQAVAFSVAESGSDGTREQLARVPMLKSGVPASQYIDAVFSLAGNHSRYTLPTWMLIIALAGTAAFLLVYHQLRRHFHSYSRIAENLLRDPDSIERRISELRIGGEQDQVTSCWNKLIAVTAELQEEVSRSTASEELFNALSKSKTGELAEAMATVPVGIILFTDDRNTLYSNAMSRRIMGWPRDQQLNPSFTEDTVSEDGKRICEFIIGHIDNPYRATTVDTQIEGGDGSFYSIKVVSTGTHQRSSRCVAIILDVSQQVRADKAREEFVSQVTHELRTPLTNIRAYTETLSSGMFDDPKVINDCYNVITKETRRLSRLIEDILSISQLEVGTMQLVLDNVELMPLLSESVRDVRGIAESKNIDLQLDLPPKLPTIQGDRDKLAVVVNNLIGNAIKYTPNGGQVCLSCKATEEAIGISVRDTGIGIDPKDHVRIFEKFQRSDDELVRAETGTGIGLTTAQEVVNQHGGSISVVSKRGEGSTFTATIPLTKNTRSAQELTTAAE